MGDLLSNSSEVRAWWSMSVGWRVGGPPPPLLLLLLSPLILHVFCVPRGENEGRREGWWFGGVGLSGYDMWGRVR